MFCIITDSPQSPSHSINSSLIPSPLDSMRAHPFEEDGLKLLSSVKRTLFHHYKIFLTPVQHILNELRGIFPAALVIMKVRPQSCFLDMILDHAWVNSSVLQNVPGGLCCMSEVVSEVFGNSLTILPH